MGVLSNKFKPNFLGLLKFINSMNWFIVFFSLINLSMCIYEDQIGKFDWRQTYIGRIKFAQFDTVSTAKKIIVATEENVLAALNMKTGQVVWRHVFETASSGNIQLLHVADKVTSVTGSNPYLVRGWDTNTGILLWEWSLTLQDDYRAEYAEWWVQNGMLVNLLPFFGSHLEVSMYNLVSGSNRGSTSKLPAQWTNEGCVLTAPYYSCVSGSAGSQLLLSLDVTSKAVQILSKPLSDFINLNNGVGGELRELDGSSIPGFIVDNKKIILLRNNKFEPLSVEVSDSTVSAGVVDGVEGPMLLQIWNEENKAFSLRAHSIETGKVIPEISSTEKVNIPEPDLLAGMCSKSGREQHVCRLLVGAADDAVHLMQQAGRTLWSRQEALANVVAVEFVDLPVSDTDAELETEFGKEGSVWSAFTRRLYTQYQQLTKLASGLDSAEDSAELVRDYFNLHKVIMLVTQAGKIFGMDNLSGRILWERYEAELNSAAALVFTRRAARHPPADAVVSVIGKHVDTGNGYIVTLDPLTGSLVEEGRYAASARLRQATLAPAPLATGLRALLLLDEDDAVQVIPHSAAPLVENMYMYVAEKETGKVEGFALRYNGKELTAVRTWSSLPGGAGARVVAAVAARAADVRSPGRALPDRSVLYKYTNPALLLLVLQRKDRGADEVVSVALDGVTGAVVAGATHRRASALPLAVHADNCLAYLYRNDKHRRVEIATMELYEGPTRWSSPGAPFSSWEEWRAASVRRAAYVLPATPTTAALTHTRRQIADTHLLLGLSTGSIVELPWALLEARRLGAGPAGEGMEGTLPYTPELPLPADAAVNYNRTLERLAAIHAAPAGLESTSLVLATGLDLYYTRVAPSKTFDLLKDDFDYYLITIVLIALLVATYSTKYFASRKMLKQAWK
ncbi:ER membrane protein complex subunit 1 isoform X2 [Aricia agestis]|uniref:ER membrane protein complex subunit 1 isoform X2 n=1 Tax=Aricia agestis TaxID=91739 RepID=UPI001C206440|nr:ER membrane protein complex subunit 1 isoform X2 [Aricia agestis]